MMLSLSFPPYLYLILLLSRYVYLFVIVDVGFVIFIIYFVIRYFYYFVLLVTSFYYLVLFIVLFNIRENIGLSLSLSSSPPLFLSNRYLSRCVYLLVILDVGFVILFLLFRIIRNIVLLSGIICSTI